MERAGSYAQLLDRTRYMADRVESGEIVYRRLSPYTRVTTTDNDCHKRHGHSRTGGSFFADYSYN